MIDRNRRIDEISTSRRTTRKMRALAYSASLFVLGAIAPAAKAQSLADALKDTTVHGMIAAFNWDYLNHNHSSYDTHAMAIGGNVVAHTGSFYGFSAGAGFYTGQSLGLYSDPKSHSYDDELYGPTGSLQGFREAYLQYQNKKVELRFGRQMIQTPYANQDYNTMNPRAFMGLAGVYDVIGEGPGRVDSGVLGLNDNKSTLSVFATRMFRYASRYANGFTSSNANYSGKRSTNGFIAFGTQIHHPLGPTEVTAQGWYYNFYDYAQLYYGQIALDEQFAKAQHLTEYFQVVSEGNSGNGDAVAAFTNGQARKVNAHIYGGQFRYTFPLGWVALVGDYSPVSYGAFRHGGEIHPYNDNSGTEFTDAMHTGLGDLGPGIAYGVTSQLNFIPKKFILTVNYERYIVRYGYGVNTFGYTGQAGFPSDAYIPNEHIWALDVNPTYNFSGRLSGLSISDHNDVAVAENRPGYPHYANPYFSNRIYIEYKF